VKFLPVYSKMIGLQQKIFFACYKNEEYASMRHRVRSVILRHSQRIAFVSCRSARKRKRRNHRA